MSVVGSCSASHLDFFFKFCVVLKDCLYIYDYNVAQFSEVVNSFIICIAGLYIFYWLSCASKLFAWSA